MQDTTDSVGEHEIVNCAVCGNSTRREIIAFGLKLANAKCKYCGSTLLVNVDGITFAMPPDKEGFPGVGIATLLSWIFGLVVGGLIGGSVALVFELLNKAQIGILVGLAITFGTAKTLQGVVFARYAVRRLAPLAAKDARNPDTCVQVALYAQKREIKEKYLREALLRNPRHRDAIVCLAGLLIADKQTSSAVSLLEMLPALWKDPLREKLLAQAYESDGNAVAAVEHLKKLLSLTNDTSEKEEIQDSIARVRLGRQRH